MGQKVHPTGFRIGVIQEQRSKWFANSRNYPELVEEDYKIRKYLKKRLYSAGVSRILIERKAQAVTLSIIAAKPGIIVGRGGQGIDELRKDLSKFVNKKVQVNVLEVARVDADAQLVAEFIAQQLEKRVVFRRAMKQAIQRAMRSGALGIKVAVAGRLGGAEIARTEWAKEGRIPLQTLRADVDYGFAEADTIMGIIGVKIWIFKGEILPGEKVDSNVKAKGSKGSEGAPSRAGRGKRRRPQQSEQKPQQPQQPQPAQQEEGNQPQQDS